MPSGTVVANCRTHEDERTVLKSLDSTKPNTNPKTNRNPNPKLTLFSCFMLFEHRPLIFNLALIAAECRCDYADYS